MKDLSSMPLWQWIALAVFIVAAGAAFVGYRRGKKKR